MLVLRKPQALGCVRPLFVAGLLASLAVSSGCQTAAGTGAAAGAMAGYGIGGLVGHCPGAALIGAAIGGASGLLAGEAVDIHGYKKGQRAAQAAAADAAAHALSLNDVVMLTQNAVPPAQIIEKIRTSGVVYRLSAEDILALNRQGVDTRVINALQDTALRPIPAPQMYTAAPMVVQQPVYVAPQPAVVAGGFVR